MANLSVSELAGLRIRQARLRHGWTARDLADRCGKAGAARITPTVITNLETRRRSTREITVDELLILARVLEVPPLQLMVPLDAGEELEVAPDVRMDALEAVAWISGPVPADLLRVTSIPVPANTERMLRLGDPGNVLTIIRQLRIAVWRITEYDRLLSDAAFREQNPDSAGQYGEYITVMAGRLMHLAAQMQALGYEPPGLESVREILDRRGLPSTLAQWREQAAGDTGVTGHDDSEET